MCPVAGRAAEEDFFVHSAPEKLLGGLRWVYE